MVLAKEMFLCPICEEPWDSPEGAGVCCMGSYEKKFMCEECEECYDTKPEAEDCCDEDAD